MTKRNKIIYWIFTCWMALGLVSTGIVQILGTPEEASVFKGIGFPLYLMGFLGASKMLACVVLLLPKLPRIKEWAYAGLTFTFLGAIYSHLTVGDPFALTFPPILLLSITAISWYFRPEDRKMTY